MTDDTKKITIRDVLNLTALLAPQKPEPKTLLECLEEAGGFPFTATVVGPLMVETTCIAVLPIGETMTFNKYCQLDNGDIAVFAEDRKLRVQATPKRWTLRGAT